jgi:hypothetical protein
MTLMIFIVEFQISFKMHLNKKCQICNFAEGKNNNLYDRVNWYKYE